MATSLDPRIEGIRNAIASHPDFPKTGILFRDIFPVFRDVKVLQDLMSVLGEIINKKAPGATTIVGIESRGFLLGPLIGMKLGLPFVPIRKAGKLPGKTIKLSYQLEYGSDTLEVQADAIPSNSQVVVVDDLLATGGTMEAACKLIESAGGSVKLCLTAIELLDLKGKEKLTVPFGSVVQY